MSLPQNAPPATTALARWEGDRFHARRSFFSLLGPEFQVFGPDGGLRLFVKQKAFRLKEALTVFADAGRTEPLLQIQARNVWDFAGTYDVTTPGGERIGALRRQGLRSLLRDRWEILAPDDTPLATIEEDSWLFALLRRFLLGALFPQTFHVRQGTEELATFEQKFHFFVQRYELAFHDGGRLERRLGLAAAVMLLAIEGRQDS